ncbi:SET domain protein, partial [Onchocerca flexuosa]
MSIKLMKQRWLVEKVDDTKDSTEIVSLFRELTCSEQQVDMDVDEKDEYEIVSEMEKPANFVAQDVENEEPETIGINMRAQENVANLEVKRPSRWDVGAPFCIQLNDALTSNTNEAVVKKCSTDLDEAHNGSCNKTINEHEREKIFTNEASVLEITSMKIEGYAKNAETSIAAGHESNQTSNCVDLSLDKIALPSDPYDTALLLEPSELRDNAGCALAEDKHASEVTDKGKIIIKWKFTKTPKELSTGSMKIWEPEIETRELPKLNSGEQAKSILFAETSLDTKIIAENLDSDAGKSSFYIESSSQQSHTLEKIVLPPCSPKLKLNFQSQSSTVLSSAQEQLDYAMHKMKFLENEYMKEKEAPQEASEKQSLSNKGLKSNCSNVSETTLSCTKLQYNHDLEKEVIMNDEAETITEANVQKTVASWFAMHFSQELHLKKAKLSPELVSSQQQWSMDDSKTEANREGEQEFPLSSTSSATSVSIYSFNSTPKTLPSSELGILQTAKEQEQIPESTGIINADSIGSANDEPLLAEVGLALNENKNEEEPDVSALQKPVNQPAQYEHLDENIILCDENLIKEAKVVRCFCEPTSEEIAEGRGCSSGCINRELYTECGSRCPSGIGCANRRFHNKQYAKVEVFNAGVKGWGLRAAEPLEPGRFIIEYVGEVIDAEEMLHRGRRYGKDPKHVHHYLMALKNGAVIDATAKGNVSRFINHSCDPNCESQKV